MRKIILTFVIVIGTSQSVFGQGPGPGPQGRIASWVLGSVGQVLEEKECQAYSFPSWVIVPGKPDLNGDGIIDIIWWQSDPNGIHPTTGERNAGAIVAWVMKADCKLDTAWVTGDWGSVDDATGTYDVVTGLWSPGSKLIWRPDRAVVTKGTDGVFRTELLWRECTTLKPCNENN